MKKTPPFLAWIGFLAMAVLAVIIAKLIADYPPQLDPYVNDFAGLISSEDKRSLKEILSRLEQEQNIKASILTVPSIGRYSLGNESIESFALQVFKAWKLGENGKGMLILVSLMDRQVRIEFGGSYEGAYNTEVQTVVNRYMLPNFRNHQYSSGILQGTQAITSVLLGKSMPRPEFPKEWSVRIWWAFVRQDAGPTSSIILLVLAFSGLVFFNPGRNGFYGDSDGGGFGGGGDGGGGGGDGGGGGGSGDGGGGGW